MLYSIRNIEGLENLNESVSLQSQVNEVRLQETLSKGIVHANTKKLSKLLLIHLKIPPIIQQKL